MNTNKWTIVAGLDLFILATLVMPGCSRKPDFVSGKYSAYTQCAGKYSFGKIVLKVYDGRKLVGTASAGELLRGTTNTELTEGTMILKSASPAIVVDYTREEYLDGTYEDYLNGKPLKVRFTVTRIAELSAP